MTTGTGSGACEGPRTVVTATINPVPVVRIAPAGSPGICAGGSVTLTASGADLYLWSTGATSQSITVTQGGSYTVTATTAGGCTATSAATAATINPTPAMPTTSQLTLPNGTVQLTSSAATGNRWYRNNILIVGATNPTYVVASSALNGSYAVVTTTALGCASASSAAQTVAVVLGTRSAAFAAQVQVCPNPTRGAATVSLPGVAGARFVQVRVLNVLGQVVQTRTLTATAAGTAVALNLTGLAAGVYAVQVQVGVETVLKRIVLE